MSSKGKSLATAASRIRVDLAFAVMDVFIVVAAYSLGMGVRSLDTAITDASELWRTLFIALPVVVVIHLVANMWAGNYGHVWEHASTSEAFRVAVASAVSGVVLFILTGVGRQFSGDLVIPYTAIAIGAMLSLLAMGMVRFRSRLFSFHKAGGAVRVLVVGTGREAATFSRNAPELEGSRTVIGFVADSDQPGNGDRMLAGLEVLGCLEKIADVIAEHDVDEVVVIGGDPIRARRVVDLCLNVDVRLRILPAAADVMRDGVAAVDLRDIRVEDVLVRQPVETDLSAVGELIRGRRVLITGAGGSIGSEIVRQVMGFAPSGVWALDRDETLLHEAALRWPSAASIVLGDIRDAGRMLRLFGMIKPEIVFHAAALKHVPVLEDHPEEAVMTNVVGTKNVIEAGSRAGMEHFVLISTDKAVDPTSVMGATKRLAEILTQVGAERRDGCVYTAVRFGNVLGSRGSVIPTFVQQVNSGGPVTVTDPAMTRYFMTVDEAVQLVLQASALATGSEIYLLDMGEPVKIDDLARRLIRLAGLTPDRDIEIVYTGRRPGEKLEEVLTRQPLGHTSHDKIYDVRQSHPDAAAVMDTITQMEDHALNGETWLVLKQLNEMTDGQLSSLTSVDLSQGVIAESVWS